MKRDPSSTSTTSYVSAASSFSIRSIVQNWRGEVRIDNAIHYQERKTTSPGDSAGKDKCTDVPYRLSTQAGELIFLLLL